MAIAEQIIFQFNSAEHAAFREYLQEKGADTIEFRLYDLLIRFPEASSGELIRMLYGSDQRNAFKRCQQRLTRRLTEFIFQRSDQDPGKHREVLCELALGRYMARKHCFDLAAYFLNRAEVMAGETRQYELLDTIYSIQIRYAVEMGTDLDELRRKWQINRAKCDSLCRLNFTYAHLRSEFNRSVRTGVALDVNRTLKDALKKLRLTPAEANDPAFMHQLVSLVRKIAISNKAYVAFERVITRIYKRLKKSGAFTPADAELEMGFLYMLAHAHFRNARFAEASAALDQADKLCGNLSPAPVALSRKIISLRASIANYTGRIHEAIALLENELTGNRKGQDDNELLNMQLSLAAYYFNAREYRKAMRTMMTFPCDTHTLGKRMGMEWRFKKEMFELIAQFELGNFDQAIALEKRMRSGYATLFRQDMYARIVIYLDFVSRMIDDPLIVTTDEFRQDVKQARLNLSSEEEDIQAIAFYCWLTSKMFRKDYYEVLLNAINWKIGEGNATKVTSSSGPVMALEDGVGC